MQIRHFNLVILTRAYLLLTECENVEIDLDNLMYSNVEIFVRNGFEENPIIQYAFIACMHLSF